MSLADPKQLIASQAVVPLVDRAAATPTTARTLNRVSSRLTTQGLERMVRRVEIVKADAAEVAQQVLRRQRME